MVMVTILFAVVSIFAFRFRSRAALELKLVALEHQLAVLRRQRPGRPQLSSLDRLLWVLLYRIWPQVIDAMVLVKPATVVEWHRRGFRFYWRWRSCGWRIHNYAAIGICATGPGRARQGAASAGLPGPIRLCEDLRIRHGQHGRSEIGVAIRVALASPYLAVLAVASSSISIPGHASAVMTRNVPAGWVTLPKASALHFPAGKK